VSVLVAASALTDRTYNWLVSVLSEVARFVYIYALMQ